MPTPENNNNSIYVRLYKTYNALGANEVYNGDTDNNQLISLSVKGSIEYNDIQDNNTQQLFPPPEEKMVKDK